MPGRDGTGPGGKQGGAGKPSKKSQDKWQMKTAGSVGKETFCECLSCESRVKHERGIPCSSISCPECGSPMVRA